MISIIIPVYNEEEVLEESYKRIKEVANNLKEDYELIFIDDGSRDNTLSMLKEIADNDDKSVVISFSRNFGHQQAVTCGMEYAKGDAAIIIDADLQDPPKVIYEMVEKWKEGYDIVYGKRVSRAGEKAFKKLTAFVYYRVVGALSEFEIPKDSGDFRLISRKVIDTINSMPEHNRYLRGMNAFVGYNTYALEYEREARFAGKTKYSMKKMVKLATDGIISNSNKPLYLAIKTAVALGVLSALGLIALIVLQILVSTNTVAFNLPIEFWTMELVLIGITGIVLSHGISNAYLARIYDEVKNRPKYIVNKTYNLINNKGSNKND